MSVNSLLLYFTLKNLFSNACAFLFTLTLSKNLSFFLKIRVIGLHF